MKFKPEISALPAGILEPDYAKAQNMGKVHLGEQCLYFRKLSGTSYLPYNQIVRAWLRQEEVRARMCCATANFDQFYLVMACTDGQERRGQVLDKPTGQQCLDHIAAQNPSVKIGYIKPTQSGPLEQ